MLSREQISVSLVQKFKPQTLQSHATDSDEEDYNDGISTLRFKPLVRIQGVTHKTTRLSEYVSSFIVAALSGLPG